MDGTLHIVDGRNVLRFERRLAHPVEKVWRAVSDPAEMANWFPARVELDPQVGGRMSFSFPGGEMDATGGAVTELDPPRVFAFDWNGDLLRTELSPDGDGTLLVFTYTFGDRPMAASFATGWDTCLGAMEQALAGPGADISIAPQRYAERHDAYLAAFGLDEGTVRDTGEGFTVRFERLLPHPVQDVWRALTDTGEPSAGGEPPLRTTHGYLTAGPLTEVEPEQVLEYAWSGDDTQGRVRWELTGGHPAGTRVVLTQTGPTHLADALAAWHTHLELFAARLRGEDRSWPDERVRELEKHYSALVEAR